MTSPSTHTVRSPDGIPIACETHGHGEPAVVFVHGWSCDRTYWSLQVEPFSQTTTVVTIDLAGHGTSGLGRRTQSMTAFGADVAAVVEHLKLSRVVLVGHSMGGDVILEAARQIRPRIAGLIWVDAYRRLPVVRSAADVEGLMAPFRADFVASTRSYVRELFPPTADPRLVERIVADVSSAPPSIAIPALEAAFQYAARVPAVLAELRLPVAQINPDDETTDVASLERHNVAVRLLPGVGHFPFLEAPDAHNRMLSAMLESMNVHSTQPSAIDD